MFKGQGGNVVNIDGGGPAEKNIAFGGRIVFLEFPERPCLFELDMDRAFDFDG